jgi:predicted dehydrogenase
MEDMDRHVEDSRVNVEVLNCNQEAAMITHFSDLVSSGKRDPFWPRVALQTQAVLDACYASAKAGGARTAVEPIGMDL